MTPLELKELILALADDHPAKVAFLAGNDTACAVALSAKTLPGLVPIRELSAYCIATGITGGVLALDTINIGQEIVEGVSMTMQIKGMLKTVLTLLLNDFRLEEADVQSAGFGAAADGLIQLGVMTPEQKAELVAMANNRSPIAAVGHLQVAEARAA